MVAKTKSKKVSLKTTKKDDTLTLKEASEISQSAINAISKKNLTFEEVMTTTDTESLQELRDYLKKNKSNIAIKLEQTGTFLPSVKAMIRLKCFLETAISRSCDLIHDAIVSEFSIDDDDFDFEAFKSAVSERIGKLSGQSMET